jgi:hypothetical protein
LAQLPSAETEIEFLYRYQADFLAFETDKLIGTHTGLTVGTDNQAHLFFRDEAAPYGTGQIPETQYSSNNDEGEVCLSESVALTGGHWHSAEVNKDGAVCVAYQDEETLKLHYACQSHVASCVQWDVEVADNTYNVGAHTSLGFTSENQPYISYYDTENGSLKLATKVDGNWQAITLDGDEDKDVGLFTNLNIDTEDKIHITYQNQTDNSIWYAVGH